MDNIAEFENDFGNPGTKTLSLCEIFTFMDVSINSRTFVEGERILNSQHIVVCGRKASTSGAASTTIVGLCLSTSALKGNPHVVSAVLENADNGFKIYQASCTCRAGNSEKCKHIMGVLLRCNRDGVLNLPALSVTDVECAWKKKPGKELYGESTPLDTYCHISQAPPPFTVSSSESEDLLQDIIESCPESALSRHSKRRTLTSVTTAPALSHICEDKHGIVAHSSESELMVRLEHILVPGVAGKDETFYQSTTVITSSEAEELLCITHHNKQRLLQCRKTRITGTTSYRLYTYKGSEWKKKTAATLLSSFAGNPNTRYGNQMEQRAREVYMEQTNSTAVEYSCGVQLVECGLVVPAKNPWIGYTPDGIVMNCGKPEKLLEIK
ncbi:uncharacterized protein LOC135387264 [Ornithodoros turicata]|uniref:uncharacterized protein LOC135387264 n=1 Tax=Ornithodoros turicata TaxID=34597 RepID=UPI00313A308F